jgi:hypothetical protein
LALGLGLLDALAVTPAKIRAIPVRSEPALT